MCIRDRKSAAFVFWTGLYNVEKGDKLLLKVTDPNGNIFVTSDITLERNRARHYQHVGRKIGRVQLIEGTYTGHVTLIRDDNIKKETQYTVQVR